MAACVMCGVCRRCDFSEGILSELFFFFRWNSWLSRLFGIPSLRFSLTPRPVLSLCGA